jgi:imidazolonepropionase-like amidohydrolase
MKQAGVPFVIGTDTGRPWRMTGFNMHEALEETVRAGLTPLEAITAATSSAARLLRQDGEWGTITTGKRADLVLLDADPIVDIANTRQINSVVVNGRLLDRRALDEMLAKLERDNAE